VISSQHLYASNGYTTAQDGRTTVNTAYLLRQLSQSNLLFLDIYIIPDYISFSSRYDLVDWKPYVSKNYTQNFRVAGGKLVIDGSIQIKTAWLSEPYYIVPNGYADNYTGFPTISLTDLATYAQQILNRGLQLVVHSNGDQAI
jgi:predicted amidohydrolase YtcJ